MVLTFSFRAFIGEGSSGKLCGCCALRVVRFPVVVAKQIMEAQLQNALSEECPPEKVPQLAKKVATTIRESLRGRVPLMTLNNY